MAVVLFTCILFGIFIDLSSSEIFTPPPPGEKPVISNGIVYNLRHVPVECQEPHVIEVRQIRYGMVLQVNSKRAIMKIHSPYKVHGNIEIPPSSCLYIEPNVTLLFGPGYGMIVNGTLIARGSEEEGGRIKMTKDPENEVLMGTSTPFPTDARLMDGNTTRDGKLELFYNGRWRGVCTNYINFTKIDANVTCRHLGFVWGNFTYHSFSRNKTEYMLFGRPNCRGSENSLFDCTGGSASNIKVGHHICDGQQLVGFQCAGLRPDLAKGHWRGIEMYNVTVDTVKDGNLYFNKTLSWLEYLDISYAGKDVYRGDGNIHGRASISASPYVPLMNNITVTHGAYDGLNLTDIIGPIHIANSTIAHNRGYGVYTETGIGRILINKTDVDNNWGDGVKMYMKNYTIYDWELKFPSSRSFCRAAVPSEPNYPFFVYENILDTDGEKPLFDGYNCRRTYNTVPGHRVSIHFMLMERDPTVTAKMRIYDQNERGRLIKEFAVTNGSFPQSVTSDSNRVMVQMTYSLPSKPASNREHRCKTFRPCLRFLLQFWSDEGLDEELRFINSSASNNTGYGLNIQDMRCKVAVNSSVVSDNKYGAGIRIYQGAGEVAINNTLIENNARTGINISYAGGYQLVNNSKIISTEGYGMITEYIRLNNSRFELFQKMEIARSVFAFNEWIAVRVGNYCRGGQILINTTDFFFNKDEAVEYLSCNVTIEDNKPPTNMTLAFNTFRGNKRHGILMSPLVNTVGLITNNTFAKHNLGAVRIDNTYDLLVSKWYSKFKVDYKIYENTFTENDGRYAIDMRLTQNSPKQKMEFKFNRVVNNNISNVSPYLNPRNRANAPIIVSSGNIDVQRNYIYNPDSIRDIATHLVDPSVTIEGSYNWWGPKTDDKIHEFVHSRIFDKDDRFNLANIEYFPVLREQWLYTLQTTHDIPKYRWVFNRGNKIGGVLDTPGFTAQPNMRYHVDKDIFIIPGATLELKPDTILEFENSIGMVVHGRLKADGFMPSSPVRFTLKVDPDEVAVENRTASVRLIDGKDDYEGRLEVEILNTWGSVCNKGWIKENSAVVCSQLGLTYDPAHGEVKTKIRSSSMILLSRVMCNHLDTDLTQCESEKYGEFSCDHNDVVYLRCQPPTWAGVTLPAVPKGSMPESTQIRHVIIENAGLLDADEMKYTPGLTIDYNYLKITGLIVRNSVSDGVNVKYSHPHTENLFEHCMFDNNQGHGFLTRSPFLRINYATMNNNEKSGFVYDPYFTEYEALSVRNFIEPSLTVDLTLTQKYNLGKESMIFIVSKPGDMTVDHTYMMEIKVSYFDRITLQLLDYNPLTNIEQVTIYDSNEDVISPTTKRWEIEKDMVDFPLVSTSNFMTIAVLVRGVVSGRLAFAAISKTYPFEPPHSIIHLYNCTIQHNKQGVLTKHYNNPSNEKLEIFHRIKEEEIKFVMVNVFDNEEEAMYIPSLTKYHDQLIPTPEEMTRPERLGIIKYTMERCKFHRNGKGILADHNHVDFANNVWQWTFNDSEIKFNKYGGFDIELPRVNDIVERKYHSVFVQACLIQSNQQFVFNINGYYANVTIKRSTFVDNNCIRGLVYIGGMEKDLTVHSNIFQRNIGKFVVELDMTSHSEYFELGVGKFYENSISDNRPSPLYSCKSSSTPSTYAVGIRGVLNITFNRNIFQNPLLQFELIAGIYSLLVTNTLNVKENWWGTPVQYAIRRKIFDFDDWNSYIIADYFPHLTVPNIIDDSAVATGVQDELDVDLERLGGRLHRDFSLPYSSTPYKVVSDWTIMPNAKLIIPPGTVLQFNPNVGILALGQLVARGSVYSRIRFEPAIQSIFGNNCVKKKKRSIQVHGTSSGQVRLRRDENGTVPLNQGFLELYNSTTDTWTIMCDSKFNKKTAEVVCRELGLETVNVDVRFTHLYDFYLFGKPMYFRKEFWTYSYYCAGDEPSLDKCMKRINYDIQKCIQASNYTFIRCGARTLDKTMSYWGNIRFSSKTYEETVFKVVDERLRSRLEYVDIDGAGMLHGEKVGSVQTTYITPILKNINITRCLGNGFDIVSPRYDIEIQHINASRNLGYGINVLMLNGESSDDEKSSFIPLITNTVPYFMTGLVDICRMEKEIFLENRVIVYYKYSQYERSCVKVIEGNNKLRKVSFRLLQFNLYQDDFYRNVIEIFNGKEVSTSSLITELTSNSTEDDLSRRYMASGDTISIHIHASSAHEHYGFIAEIVTSPLSYSNYPDSNTAHRFEDVVLRNNEDGAVFYQNIGEINPSIYFDRCWMEGNGIAILNLTSPPVIDFNIQNTILLNFQHSLVSKNKGGMYIHANAKSFSTHLEANITNNVFSYGTNGEAINISGHHFQQFYFYENHIFNYTAGDYRDVIHVQNVGTNFTFNTIENNVGHYILRIFNQEDTDALQRFLANAFWNNNVTALKRSTIKVGSGHPYINVNFLVNPESDFELETYPITEIINGVVIQNEPINAKENWWGSERPNFVLGRIWDYRDNQSLNSVNYNPIKVTNSSLIDGKCAPGWRLNDQRCYRYMGAAMPYYDALAFCKASGGYLADYKDKRYFLQYLLRLTENVYVDTLKVWVYAEVAKGYCSAFQDSYVIAEQECHRKLLPFICERDPYITAPEKDILALIIGICAGVFGTGLIIIIILVILWYVKSKRRKEERFERAASIRSSYSKSSLHQSRLTLGTRSQISILTDGSPRKRRGYDDRSVSDRYSTSTASKHKIYDSDESVTLGGIGVDERRKDMQRNINRSREYLEDVIDSRDKMRNGHTFQGSRDRLDMPNGVSRSRERLDDRDRYGSKDSLGHSPRIGGPTRTGLDRRQPNKMQNPRLTELTNRKNEYVKKPTESPGSSLDRKLIKRGEDYQDTMTDDTFDGYSTNEFDDITSEHDGDTDAVKFHPTKFSQINNEIHCLQKPPSMDNIYANDDTPSVNRSKSLSSFLQPLTPQGNPPTPPPPFEETQFKSSPNLSPAKPRPVPKPRSSRNSNVSSVGDYVEKFKDNKPVSAPLHLSRENLNFAHKKPDWLADKLRETSASEDSDDESFNDSSFESGHNNQGYIGSHEDLTKQYNKKLNIEIPQNDLSKPTNSNPPSLASDYSNQLQGSTTKLTDFQNMDYMKDSYPSIDYSSPRSRSKENLSSPRYPYGGSRENIAVHGYPYSNSRENIATPTNLSRSRENIPDQGYLYSGSRENIPAPSYRSRSRENIAGPYGSRENLPDQYGSRENVSGYHGSRENVNYYPEDPGPPSYHASRENLQDYRGSRDNLRYGSRENLDRGAARYTGSQENIRGGVLQLQNQNKSQSIETEI